MLFLNIHNLISQCNLNQHYNYAILIKMCLFRILQHMFEFHTNSMGLKEFLKKSDYPSQCSKYSEWEAAHNFFELNSGETSSLILYELWFFKNQTFSREGGIPILFKVLTLPTAGVTPSELLTQIPNSCPSS